MTRQKVGPKKVAKYRKQTGLDIVYALVRGNSGHRVDLLLADKSIVCLYPDGTTEKDDTRWTDGKSIEHIPDDEVEP